MERLGLERPYPGKATYQKQIYSSNQPENKHKQNKKYRITKCHTVKLNNKWVRQIKYDSTYQWEPEEWN